jgi:hypothetical protein
VELATEAPHSTVAACELCQSATAPLPRQGRQDQDSTAQCSRARSGPKGVGRVGSGAEQSEDEKRGEENPATARWRLGNSSPCPPPPPCSCACSVLGAPESLTAEAEL